jgi:lipopolysaccharide biosynthesis glycosyltransferase
MRNLIILIALSCFIHFSHQQSVIPIVSIVDDTSILSYFLKLFTISKTLTGSDRLESYVVVVNTTSALNTSNILSSTIQTCLSKIQITIKIWTPPPLFQLLRKSRFEQVHIFARFYFPIIFPNLSKFIYLDNDVLVTINLSHLLNYPLKISRSLPNAPRMTATLSSSRHSSSTSRNHHSQVVSKLTNEQLPEKIIRSANNNNNNNVRIGQSAMIGMVIEDHPIYQHYLQDHFNTSHSLVQQALNAFSHQPIFLNAGVFIVNTQQWKEKNMTFYVESLIQANSQEYIYSTAVGDQGPFYLLFHSYLAFLPPQYNMRRLPKKTIHLLEQHIPGNNNNHVNISCA